MYRANFQRANLTGAILLKSRMHGANFREANLTYANLTEANGTNLGMGKSISVFLNNSNLTGANFTNADVENVDFSGAITTNCMFDKANLKNSMGMK